MQSVMDTTRRLNRCPFTIRTFFRLAVVTVSFEFGIFDVNQVIYSNYLFVLVRQSINSILFDSRISTEHEVYSIADAHKNNLFKKRERRKAAIQRSNPVSVVTALRFTNDNRLFSAGANDGCIKQWDLRMLGSDSEFNTLRCARRLEYCGQSDKAEGFTSLALDSAQQVYASCSDNRIYSYDYRGNEGKCESEYVKCFEGSAVNNYTKISVLKDDLLISGSKNSAACVWSIRDAVLGNLNRPIYKLQHGIEEVSSVTCDPMTYDLYSCDDDITISKWVLESSQHAKDKNDAVVANIEETQDRTSIRLTSQKVTASPKTPPLTSLNSWLMNSSKQNISRSAPLLPKSTEPSTSISCEATPSDSCILSPKSNSHTPVKRRASSDACLTSSKKPRSSNDENVNRRSTGKGRGRKKLFSPNRSILDYFHS
jgi:hypothetical protein